MTKNEKPLSRVSPVWSGFKPLSDRVDYRLAARRCGKTLCYGEFSILSVYNSRSITVCMCVYRESGSPKNGVFDAV